MKATFYNWVNGILKFYYIKRLKTLTDDYIKRLLLLNKLKYSSYAFPYYNIQL